jgi:glucokinase
MTLGFDLTELRLKAVVVNERGNVMARAEQPVGQAGAPQALGELARRVRRDLGKDPAAAGFATATAGESVSRDFVDALSDALPGLAPTHVDAGAASLHTEVWCGAARGIKDVVAFSVGERVTAGIMLNGQFWSGAHGAAGSVSWLTVNPVEREDYRKWGGLQAEVAAPGIVRRLVWRVKSGDHSVAVDQVAGDLTRLTADMVFAGARGGDGVCISVVRDTAKYVAMAVANLATILDPDVIVLGGLLAGSGAMMLDAIRLDCTRRLSPTQTDRVRIVLSAHGVDAIAIGAARVAQLHRQ